MSDELRAAIERLRANQYPVWLTNVVQYDINGKSWGSSYGWFGREHDERIVTQAYIAEHPADDDEPIDLGTAYCDDNTRIEVIVTGPGECSLVYQMHRTDWKWCFVRSWDWPDAPTRGDVRRLLDALGIEATK